jgi:hypothetical protein
MDVDRFFTPMNRLILGLLHSPLHFIASAGLMSLTYTGRRSGRRITIPVGYQRQGDTIIVLVSKAHRKSWWRNFEQPAEVELRVRGRRLSGEGVLIPTDAPEFKSAHEATFARIPSVAKQFGIDDYRKGSELSDAQLAVLAKQGRVIRIALEQSG